MKKSLLAPLIFTSIFSLSSVAAQNEDWSGPFVGINLGAMTARHNRTNDGGFQNSYNSNGGVNLGVHAGYNWQKENLLFGIETKLSYLGLRGDDGGTGGTVDGTKINWNASIGPKIGYIFKTDYMIYGTAGASVAGVKTTNYTAMEKSVDSKFGYFIGAGLAYKINSNWITDVSYQLTDLGDNRVEAVAVQAYNTQHKTQQISLGLSYKF
jgi:outer membrane immunogenic protein